MTRLLYHIILLGALMAASSADGRQSHRVALIHPPEWPEARIEPFGALLDAHDLTFDLLDSVSVDALAPYDLVVVPGWQDEDHTFYYALKVYFYLGGRLLGCGWGVDYWAKGLIAWIWDTEAPEPGVHVTDDGRAVYMADIGPLSDRDAFDPTFRALLESTLSLPDNVPAKTYADPKPSWAVRGETFTIDDEPVLLRGIGTLSVGGNLPHDQVERALSMHRDLNLNYVLAYSGYNADLDAFEQALDAVHRRDMHAVVWIGGSQGHFLPGVAAYSEKPLHDAAWLRHLAFRNHPALLGWNMCDDTFDRYYPFLERTRELIKRYDQESVITVTKMDTRRPDGIPEGAFQKWVDLIDYPMTYLYPLQKDETYGAVDIEGGFEDLQRLIANTQRVWEKPVYIQIWCQAHMQGPAYGRVGLGPGDTFLPSAEQQRLMTYYILQAGARGIVYFNSSSILDEHLGLGRRSEIGLVWHELDPLETIIAAGERLPLETDRDGVEAVAYTHEGETAVLLSAHMPRSNRYVSGGAVDAVTVTLPGDLAAGGAIHQLRYPDVVPLDSDPGAQGSQVRVPPFDLTALLYVTRDPDAVSRAREAYRDRLDRLSGMALDVYVDKRAKTEVILEHLPAKTRARYEKTLEEIDRCHARTLEAHRAGDLGSTYAMAREHNASLRSIQASIVEAAEASMEGRDLTLDQRRHTNIYFSLPKYYASLGEIEDVAPGQLRQETFDRIEALRKPFLNAAGSE